MLADRFCCDAGQRAALLRLHRRPQVRETCCMFAIQANRAGAFRGKNIDAEFKEFHLNRRGVRL